MFDKPASSWYSIGKYFKPLRQKSSLKGSAFRELLAGVKKQPRLSEWTAEGVFELALQG